MNSQGRIRSIHTVHEANQLLKALGASPKLLLHVKLVSEAAELLIAKLHELQVQFDEHFFRLGIVFHDSGKILHPKELTGQGHCHEADGETLLIANGVESHLARCCRSHSQWQRMDCSLEELLIALADTLWKGKCHAQLEDVVIQQLAARCNKAYWELWIEMDSCFERIAADGDSRLLRSQAA